MGKLIRFINQGIKHFFIVDGFPQTASGKIQKFKLREMAKELLGTTGEIFNKAK